MENRCKGCPYYYLERYSGYVNWNGEWVEEKIENACHLPNTPEYECPRYEDEEEDEEE